MMVTGLAGERGADREFLRGEGEVRPEAQAGGGRIRPEHPELTHADVRAGVAVHGQLRVPRLGSGRHRYIHRVARVKGDVSGIHNGPPVSCLARDLDRGIRRRAGRAQRDAQVAERADLAQVDHEAPGPG